jgi:hypothetical protein
MIKRCSAHKVRRVESTKTEVATTVEWLEES